ncbi:hypothetical protein PENSPDRAFT_649206 [Peniophora sp. CONT]|nr:hypothetical protein PENSPDRAFT_649206 [Peniophora sp. CONT]
MFIKRHATTPMKSRISPHIWESFFQGFESKPDRGLMVVYIEVDKTSWVERLGFAKERKAMVEAKEREDSDARAEKLPAYSKATT